MLFCKNCGKPLDDNESFCGNCGANVFSNESSAPNDNSTFKIDEETAYFDPPDIEQNKVICAVSYLSILFFLPLAFCPNSKFGKFHANQALILLIAKAVLGIAVKIVSSIVFGIIGHLPLFNSLLGTVFDIIFGLIGLIPVAGMIFGIVTAAQGKAKRIPIIGKFNIIK